MIDLDAASLLTGKTCPCPMCTTIRGLVKEVRDSREQFRSDSFKLAKADKLVQLVDALDVDDVQPRYWSDLRNAADDYLGVGHDTSPHH